MLAQVVLIAIIFILILILCFKKSPPQSDEEDGDGAAARSSAEMAARTISASENSPEKRKKMASVNLFHRTLEEGDSVGEIQSILAAARDISVLSMSDGDDGNRPVSSAPPASERHDAGDDKTPLDTKEYIDEGYDKLEQSVVGSMRNSIRSVTKENEKVEQPLVGSMRNSIRSVTETLSGSIGQVMGSRSTDPECTICLEKFSIGDSISWPKYGDCDHIYHTECITEWLALHDDCPLCRVAIIGNVPEMRQSNEEDLVIRPAGSADER